MNMSEARRGEIALLLLKEQMRDKGIRIPRNFRREAGNEAKRVGVSVEEMMEFLKGISRELLEQAFADEGSASDSGPVPQNPVRRR